MKLHDYLDYYARETPDAEFARLGDRAWTYAEARREADRLAQALVASGLEPGARAGILAKNCMAYPILYFGCSKAGVVPVPLNYRLAPPEWSYILKDSGARMVIARGELATAVDSVRAELPEVGHWLALDTEPPAGWGSFEEFVAPHPATPCGRSIDAEHDVYQMYTSGTTGRPKGALLTHRAVTSNVAQLQSDFPLTGGDRYLIVAPLYHAAAGIALFLTVGSGGSILLQEDFIPADVVRALSEEDVALTTLVPAMIQACLVMVPDVAQRSYPKLRQIAYGASPIAEETLRRAIDTFRCDFVQGYGMTETTAVLTLLSPADHERALKDAPHLLRSCGRPILGTEVRIVDAHQNPQPVGTVGEIVARGPQMMRGYWNLEEASFEALGSGWLRTGDAGRMDEEGYVFIEDRVKDMIVSGGENVYPREIENLLFEHAAVADVAVIGIPDPVWGEAVKAVVVLREGAEASAQDLLDFCRGRLAGYKLPKSVDFLPELPRNPSGKVLKTQLREPYWRGRTRQVS